MSADPITTLAKPAPDDGKDAARRGAIVLIRHGEPDLSRKIKLNAAGYIDWWARYETMGIKPGQTAPPALVELARQAIVISSTRPRAIESAEALAGQYNFQKDPDLIEAPLPPPHWPDWLMLAPRSWGVIARVWWWFFDHHAGQETRVQAQARAEEMAARLVVLATYGKPVLVIAHGFFNTMIGMALRRRGWRMTQNQGFRYWSARRFERP